MNRSSSVLVLVNALPLLGVTLLDWSVLDILIVYWSETVIIGVINVVRMAKSQPGHALSGFSPLAPDLTIGEESPAKLPTRLFTAMKLAMAAFFLIHYGMFCLGHLFGVLVLFADPDASGAISLSSYSFWRTEYWVAVIPIALSHTFSYFRNFVGKAEYKNVGLFALMGRPYGRILTMHIVIIAGGYFVQWLGSPQLVLVVLVLTKTICDFRSHNKERSRFAAGSGFADSETGKNALERVRENSVVPHRFLIGRWQVISQDPSQEELMKMITNSGETDADGLSRLSTIYAIGEKEIVIGVKGVPVVGGATRMGYTVEGDRLLLQHRSNSLWSQMLAAYQPAFFEFDCQGSQLELVSSPISAYHNQRIRYQLCLVN